MRQRASASTYLGLACLSQRSQRMVHLYAASGRGAVSERVSVFSSLSVISHSGLRSSVRKNPLFLFFFFFSKVPSLAVDGGGGGDGSDGWCGHTIGSTDAGGSVGR